MKKSITIFSLLLLLISTILPNGLIDKVEAAEQELEPGEYTIPVEFLKDDADEQSTMQKYVEGENVNVEITDDSYLVSLTLTDANLIKEFGVNGEALKAVSESGDTRTYEFMVENFDDIISGFVSVDVPNVYSATHDVRIQFDASEIPEKEVVIEPEGEETPVFFWHESDDKQSSMQNFVVGDQALITREGDTTYATISLSSPEMVTDFGVKGDSADIVSEDGETRTYKFPVTDIDGLTEGFVEVDTGPRGPGLMQHQVRIYFGQAPVFEPEGEATPIFFWDQKNDKASSMQRYVEGDALITTENGATFATVTLSESNLITDFGVNNVSAEVVSEDVDAATRTYKFPVTDIDGLTEGFVEVDTAPRGPGLMQHDVGIYFNQAPVAEEPEEEPKEPEEPQNDFIYEDGTYDLPTSVYKYTDNLNKLTLSSMDDMLEKDGKHKSKVKIKNGQATVYLGIGNASMIKKFTVNGEKTKREDMSDDIAVFSFAIDDLNEIQPAFIAVETPVGAMEHDILLGFDTSNLVLKEGVTKPKPSPKPTKRPKQTSKTNTETIASPKNEKSYAEGTYPIPVFIFKESGSLTKDNLSMMHTEYLVEDQSTVYLEKGKDPLVTIVLKNANLIQSFTVEGNEAKRVNLANGQASFTFSVKNLDEIANGKIVIDTGFAIMPHDIRIGFDTSDIPGADNNGGALGSFLSAGDDNLTFDRFADGEQVTAANASIKNKNINPKTDDMNYAKMSLFALLFLMSTALLGVFIRKRFVKSV